MSTTRKLVQVAAAFAGALATACAAAAAGAASAPSAAAQATFQQSRAACMSSKSNQDPATCLKEASAALDESRRGNLTTGAQDDLRRNANDRCGVLAGAERSDCLARMKGQGSVSGSVSGGGILREKVTIEPVPAAASSPKDAGSRPAGSAGSAPK